MSLPELRPLEPGKYRWEKISGSSPVVRRLANGTEAWVGIKDANEKGQYDLYLNTTLRIADMPFLSLAKLKECFVSALVHVRTQHPEVACTAVWEEAGPLYIQYAPPTNTQQVYAWALETIEARTTHKSGLGVRAELEQQRREMAKLSGPESAKNVAIFLVADVEDQNTVLKSGSTVDVLMHFNHVFWDGISARQFVGDLLRQIGKNWNSTQSIPEFSWGDEIANLSPPILDAMKIDIENLNEDFKIVRENFITTLIKSGSSWGLNVKNAIGTPRTEFYTFSLAQSEAMIRAIKSRIGPEFTISHLGHIATVLALLKFKPLPSNIEDAQLVTPLPANGRRFLRDEFADKQFGSCQASAVVEFDDLKSWVVDEHDKKALVSMMERGCRHVKESYDYWVNKDFLLAKGVSKDNFLSQFLSENPMPFTGSTIPVFITDGVVDRYVPRKVLSSFGEKLLTVDNCVFLLDTYLPDVFVRMDSWKGATALTLTYNDGYFSTDDASTFLKYVADFMLAFVQ